MSDDTQAEYDRWHDQLAAAAGEEDTINTPWHVAAAPHLARCVPGRDVFEIGCGRGALSEHLLALRAKSVTAADFSPSAVRQTQERLAGKNASVSVEDIQAVSHPDASFDTVVSFETIEHVPNPAKAVQELARVLRPGGTLILTTPNYMGIVGVFRAYKRLTGHPYTEVGQPINRFVMLPKTVLWVKRAGLEVQEWGSRGQYIPWPGRNPIHVGKLDKLGLLSRLTGLHSMIIATKPR